MASPLHRRESDDALTSTKENVLGFVAWVERVLRRGARVEPAGQTVNLNIDGRDALKLDSELVEEIGRAHV